MIYLDNAATSWPKPEIVYQTMDKFIREKGGNAGHGSHSLATTAQQVIDETRLLTARFINSPEVERVIFTLNCTDSINMALKGILEPGDHVITSSLEHNAVMRPLSRLAARGVKVTSIPVSLPGGISHIEDIEKAITPRTRMIIMNHVSNVTGVVQPVHDYGVLAEKHGLLLVVDAAQSAGHIPLDVVRDKIDLLAFSAHKGPLGPPGVGLLYVGRRAELDSWREGGTGSNSELEEQPDKLPYKYESGTFNSSGIAGLGAALKYIHETGFDRIQTHEQQLALMLLDGLKNIPGVDLLAPDPGIPRVPVISFNILGYQPGEVGVILDQAFDIKVRTGLHCAPRAHKSIGTFPQGTVRLSPGFLNTEKEIENTLMAIRKIAVSKNR
jgi:cysteine desulfurase family protein